MNRLTGTASNLLALRSRSEDLRIENLSGRRINPFAGFARIVLTSVILFAATNARAEQDAFLVMRGYGDFGISCNLIERAGLVDAFKADGPITAFAPADKAFERMDANELRALQQLERIEDLRSLIRYHVVNQKLSKFDLKREKPYRTIEGEQVQFVDMGGDLLINDAYVDTADIRASNGRIHAIDKVLKPSR